MNLLTIGYTTEGKTDKRFLGNIIRRTFEDLSLACTGQIEIYEPQHIEITGATTFTDRILRSAKEAKWAHILCIHADSDANNDENVMQNKITPSFQAVEAELGHICKNLVAIVPIQMTEAWMLIDKELLKGEIATTKRSQELGLPRPNQIENITDPKALIEEAMRRAYSDLPKRRRRPIISELYTPISQKVPLSELLKMPSYEKFQKAARDGLRKLNYLTAD
jgi:hypothetical protein